MSLEEAIRHYNKVAESYADTVPECECARDNRQLASWLQELKERREKESRGIHFDKPFVTIQVDKDMIQRVIDETIDNMYFECKNCGQKMFPQRKEESK